MDRTQLSQFVDLMVGFTTFGVDSAGEEVMRPICPEMRAYIIAWLGDKTPTSGYTMLRRKEEMRAMAQLFTDAKCALETVIYEDKHA